jgi:hypothetical protein
MSMVAVESELDIEFMLTYQLSILDKGSYESRWSSHKQELAQGLTVSSGVAKKCDRLRHTPAHALMTNTSHVSANSQELWRLASALWVFSMKTF